MGAHAFNQLQDCKDKHFFSAPDKIHQMQVSNCRMNETLVLQEGGWVTCVLAQSPLSPLSALWGTLNPPTCAPTQVMSVVAEHDHNAVLGCQDHFMRVMNGSEVYYEASVGPRL